MKKQGVRRSVLPALAAFFLSLGLCSAGFSAILRENTVVLLPMECSELLPDSTPFIRFFEAVARGNLRKDRNLAQRLFRLLALREKIQNSADQSREQNSLDLLIRKTLCFYREKKEPLKVIPYDDPAFLDFLRGSLSDLETKVEDTVFNREFDKHQRREYEKLLTQNQELEEQVRSRAEVEADRNYERLSKAARKKARIP